MFKDKIKEIRKEKNMTRKEFAEVIGFADNTIYIWERGVSAPGLGSILQIAERLDIDPKELL